MRRDPDKFACALPKGSETPDGKRHLGGSALRRSVLFLLIARFSPPRSGDPADLLPGRAASHALLAVWRAGRVRRWHQNAELSATSDFLDGHAGRVARTVLALNRDARAVLLAACLTHDDGERDVGDLSTPRKAALSIAARAELEVAEGDARAALWGRDFCAALAPAEVALLKLADRLDALLWVRAHVPASLDCDDWREAAAAIRADAARLGFSDTIEALLRPIPALRPGRFARLAGAFRRVIRSRANGAGAYRGLGKGLSNGIERKSARRAD